MSTTRAPRKSSKAATATTVIVDPTARHEDEDALSYVTRMVEAGDAASIDAAGRVVLVEDDIARRLTFEGRVRRSVMVGRIIVGHATLAAGAAPEDFDDVVKGLNMLPDIDITSKSGEYLDRKYSTLSECYRIARDYSEESVARFVEAYTDKVGKSPEAVKHYAKFAYAAKNPDSKRAETVVDDLSKRLDTEEADKVKSEAKAAERATTLVALKAAGMVEGCPLTSDEWKSMDEATLRNVELYARHLAGKLAKQRNIDSRKSTENVTASETGPAPSKRARTSIAA